MRQGSCSVKMLLQSSSRSNRPSTGMGVDSHRLDSSAGDAFNSEEYEDLGATVASSNYLWVDPNILKLSHRIGRGPFGDVWLATIHSSTKDFDEFHEVAVKMLPDSREHMHSLLQRFQSTYQQVETVRGVCWPQGVTIKNGRVCIIMKFLEGSIGDKIAHLPSSKLPLEDVLRYGQHLLRGILELHSHGVLALNLKPCNFLLDDQDVAVVGEFGIPMLYAGMVAPSERTVWLGSPNYMAPEQWGANVRGPVSFETDCWGFACSVIELLTGERPWKNLTPEKIFKAVVDRHEKPNVPTGLPPSLERVLKRCFEYDYRRRPSVHEILQTFIDPSEPFKVGDWIIAGENEKEKGQGVGVVKTVLGPDSVKVQFCDKPRELTQFSGVNQLSNLSLWKYSFQVGDSVRLKASVNSPRFGWPGENATEGTVSEIGIDDAVFIVVFTGSQQTWRADPLELERVAGGIVANDWVRSRNLVESNGQNPSRIGIVHHVGPSGSLKVSFFGLETLWTGEAADFENVSPLTVGQYVRLKQAVLAPRFKWPLTECGEWDTGRIAHVLPNGGLIVDFPGRLFHGKGWWADSEEIEVIRISEIEGLLKKYQHIEKMHWVVRPAVSLIGLLVAVRTGVVVVNLVTRPFRGKKQAAVTDEAGIKPGQYPTDLGKTKKEGTGSLGSVWLPSQVAAATSSVAGIMFGKGEFST